jgi:signal transduction histidine kinase/ligand-binding sensor domain-containing protein/CheY-like chemotaxis protein/HPt (histidine-containing phosphotransfer) domain-containing protein
VGLARAEATSPAVANKTEQYFFDTFDEDVGLLQTDVIVAILRARDGYLWIGTERGLTRFDGVRFVSFRSSNSAAFANNLIHCLFEDRDGRLWIGTERGVVLYHDGKFERQILQDVPVRAIAQDSQGRVWLGSFGRSLQMWQNGALRSYATELNGFSPRIRSLYVDSADRVWVGFYNQPGIVCGENGVFTRREEARIAVEIQSIAEQPRGTLWLGSGTGHRLFRLHGGELAEYAPRDGLASSQVFALQPAQDGGLWVAAGSLQKITDPDHFAITTLDRLPFDRVRTVYEDKEGSVWLGARDAGLVRARLLPYRLFSAADGVPQGGVKAVTQDPSGNVWFATANSAIGRVTPDGHVTRVELPQRAMPSTVVAARDGAIWVGSSLPLAVLRDGQWETFPNIRGVYGAFEDSKGGVWLGSASGVLRYADGKFTPIDTGTARPIVHASAFSEAPDGAVYIGTWDSGLVKIADGKATVFDRRNGLPTDDVRAVYAERDGRVWVGLRSRGLAVWENGRWLNPHALSEAVADHVSAIVEDDAGDLWLGTPAGVMWAPKAEILAAARGTQPAPRLRTTEVTDGGFIAPVWSGAQPIAWRARDHKLIFATRRGVLTIDPTNLPRNQVPPRVLIEGVTADRHPLAAEAEVSAPAGTRDITIEYTALSFIQSKQISFDYKLDGYDIDWVSAGSRRIAFYTHVPPGRYTFRVRARNSDGIASVQDATLAFVQEPHFFQTRWFFAAVTGAIAVTIFGLYRWRTASLRRENEKLNRLVANRTRELELANDAIAAHSRELELANRAKSEFLESVSHEIRNPLNGITGLLGLLKQQPQGPQARELTQSVQACARTLTHAFEEVLGYSKLEHGGVAMQENIFSLPKLLAEVVASLQWHADQHGNQVRIETNASLAGGYLGDDGKIKTIVTNFLSNAIKYAPGGTIEIRAEEEPLADDRVQVHIEVCDHGPGISLAEQEMVFKKFVRGARAKAEHIAGTGLGLATCRLLAESLDGSVGVESEPGQGATFYLCVPVRRSVLPEETPPFSISELGAGASALVVEDEPYNQVVLAGIALELGYAPEAVSTVAQALALIATKAFTVIFVDWELPDGDGAAVGRCVRARVAGDQPVIIATTAYDSDEIRQRCEAAGMDDFLSKPYDAVQVRECIQRVAARRAGRRPEAKSLRDDGHGALNLQAFQSYARRFPGQADQAQGLYVEALQQEFTALKRAFVARDAKALATAAHRLHALGGLVGAKELVDVARKLTALARQTRDVGALEPDLARVGVVLEDLQHRLDEAQAGANL